MNKVYEVCRNFAELSFIAAQLVKYLLLIGWVAGPDRTSLALWQFRSFHLFSFDPFALYITTSSWRQLVNSSNFPVKRLTAWCLLLLMKIKYFDWAVQSVSLSRYFALHVRVSQGLGYQVSWCVYCWFCVRCLFSRYKTVFKDWSYSC